MNNSHKILLIKIDHGIPKNVKKMFEIEEEDEVVDVALSKQAWWVSSATLLFI